MADITSTNITIYKSTKWFGKRVKIYEIISDGSGVTAPITPGSGFSVVLGNYKGYSVSSGVFTMRVPAGTNLSKRYVAFLAP
jgi:hypothetical protein